MGRKPLWQVVQLGDQLTRSHSLSLVNEDPGNPGVASGKEWRQRDDVTFGHQAPQRPDHIDGGRSGCAGIGTAGRVGRSGPDGAGCPRRQLRSDTQPEREGEKSRDDGPQRRSRLHRRHLRRRGNAGVE